RDARLAHRTGARAARQRNDDTHRSVAGRSHRRTAPSSRVRARSPARGIERRTAGSALMRGTTLRAALRAIAIVIALTAAVDPTITARRTPKPDVAVIASDPRTDGALADRVARTLADRYTVFRSPLPSAAATVVVGDRVPASSSGLAS